MADTTALAARIVKQRKRRPESIDAERVFLSTLAEANAILLEDAYLGSKSPHRARCSNGHLCAPRPNDLRQGKSLCRICSSKTRKRRPESFQAEARFRAAIDEQGATLLDPYVGSKKRHQVKCAEGHLSAPMAERVIAGGRVCRVCSGRDSDAAWRGFRARVEELGATVLEPEWKGNGLPHAVRCKEGHVSYPFPNRVAQGVGICRTCARVDPQTAERELLALLDGMGTTMLDPYRSANRRVRLRCARGHTFSTTPAAVVHDAAACRTCKGKAWDVFYVVQDDINDLIKFGITSGNGRRRLDVHARDGFDQVVRLASHLPDGVAPELERNVLAALRDVLEKPVRGREYYHVRVLPLVLDLVDNHPAISRS